MRGPVHWQKSSFSGTDSGDDCVELAPTPASIRILIRESDTPTTHLTTPLHALLTTLKAGTLDGR
ncbi:DUF397 domain-containing protein [Streptomyces europaeiscabiei]|uniref:DUF397 domain-containing protein n=1 Tax=Streptomyces europaeiscabiei TaxID=146819 RepID=A0ABU4NB14_9ACTN|nr:DUF397 domain-containing protein [Streptomyces europaeiscabiei]MDX2526544.1 DUF397 domain-containing protein [Streptomyces europaeiscabiei]MDX3541696.1 DUF397 domain-containing protein [Streptomyces europaeiscabiei]MDX3552037.1 DUF397 domain-containing protein [Streptomyces europaeiscabiei]MDX3669299.1 DUF397 domain-containing protein [Streptomyces europaeiscabiei]MDX3700276.1 DUF397 domain-containing protein [Streptomyces europaeiscabiei]